MQDLTESSLRDFVEVLSSASPVPGGGGASALAGAIGMALGQMVGSLTQPNPKYADVHDEVVATDERAHEIQAALLELVAKDAEVFKPLSRAYGMPKDTEEQRAEKQRVMQACLKECCAVPLAIMRLCCEAIELHEVYARIGTKIAISDVGVGVEICKAALRGASLNVFINTMSMTDGAYAKSIEDEAYAMLDTYCVKAAGIYEDVASRLGR